MMTSPVPGFRSLGHAVGKASARQKLLTEGGGLSERPRLRQEPQKESRIPEHKKGTVCTEQAVPLISTVKGTDRVRLCRPLVFRPS